MRPAKQTLLIALAMVFLLGIAPSAQAAPSLGLALENDASEAQAVTVDATSGTYRLSFGSGGPGVSETADIPATATASQLQTALNALGNVSAGGGSVKVSGGPGNAGGTSPYRVEFNGGPLKTTDVAQMKVLPGSIPLAGGVGRAGASTTKQGGIFRGDERIDYTIEVKNTGDTTTSGTTTLEVQLPGGTGTGVYLFLKSGGGLNQPPTNWSCSAIPATASEAAKGVCTTNQAIASGKSFEKLGIAVELGADAPDRAVFKATASGGGAAAPAGAIDVFDIGPLKAFGIESFEAAVTSESFVRSDPTGEPDYTQAGGHPTSGTARIGLRTKVKLTRINDGVTERLVPVENVRDVVVDTPRGFVGNALSVPEQCGGVEEVLTLPAVCPGASAVGAIFLRFPAIGYTAAIYSVEPEFGTPAQFAFTDSIGHVFVFAPKLRADDGYAISLAAAAAPAVDLLYAVPTLCGYGVKAFGFSELNGVFTGTTTCYKPGEPSANPTPLITFPTRCDGPPPRARVTVDSAEHPARFNSEGFPDLTDPLWKSAAYDNPPVTGCDQVPFEPRMDLTPTSNNADSPTGLDVELSMPTNGLEGRDEAGNLDPDAVSQANLKGARVTFPQGMAINPSAGNGLGGCAADQVKLATNKPISCPDESKIGTIEIDTPLIQETLTGAMYVGKQADAPPGALIPLYLVFQSAKDGVIIKVPAKVVTSPDGQLTVELDESPEDPFSAVRMHFAQGPRASLINPPKCGAYEIEAELFPWTGGDPVTDRSTFYVTEGPGGGSCPRGGLEASLRARTKDAAAAQPTPFLLRLSREDGSDRFRSLSITTPPGLTAYLRGVPYCPDSTLASISSALGTGQAQIDHPSCPAASQIGTVVAGAGAGPNPFYADTGKAYLAGPYKGAPLSIAVVAPAVAGPLDLGTIVVRNAIRVNPESAQITTVSDPIPLIWHGLPLDVRDIRIAIDRPHFTRNPTSCEPLRVSARVGGESGTGIDLANSFQASSCGELPFKPKLGVRLFGGTHRGAHPRLKGVITAADGEASIGRAEVTIPRSEFLDQGHIRTVCTRVQFAADACPPGAVYGHAKAWSPLLDYPVEGPVYLRSSDHYLPDLVLALKGPDYQPIEAVVVGRVDSLKGQIRTTFESPPDVPVSRFVLDMQGGNKGLLVNSRDICARDYRATVKLDGHNGATQDTRPIVRNGKCGAARESKRGHRRVAGLRG